MNLILGLCSLVLLLSAAATAEDSVALTVYNKDLGVIREIRTLSFAKGVAELSFKDVAARIDPTSVQFTAPGVSLLEQNFDYDLLSSDKLLQKFVGQELEVIGENGEVTRGTLFRAAPSAERYYDADRQIILRQPDGTVRSLERAHIRTIHYPSLPEGLILTPTLRWKVRAESGGSKPAEISYLTRGINWRADYSLIISDNSDDARLEGWVTLDNKCGASFQNAKLKLIAGDVHRAEDGVRYEAAMMKASGAPSGPEPPFEEKGFFEYHLYTMTEPTTVLDRQTKQISLFTPADLRARRVYGYDPQRRKDRVGVMMEFENRESNGLGLPLPAGLVRVFQKDTDGAREFLGDDRLEHTPRNEKVRVRVGDAFDIAVERIAKNERRVGGPVVDTDYEIRLRNHKPEIVTVTVTDHFGGIWSLQHSSHVFRKRDARTMECDVLCEPEQEVLITYTVRTGL